MGLGVLRVTDIRSADEGRTFVIDFNMNDKSQPGTLQITLPNSVSGNGDVAFHLKEIAQGLEVATAPKLKS